jgi:hypothetical protein
MTTEMQELEVPLGFTFGQIRWLWTRGGRMHWDVLTDSNERYIEMFDPLAMDKKCRVPLQSY